MHSFSRYILRSLNSIDTHLVKILFLYSLFIPILSLYRRWRFLLLSSYENPYVIKSKVIHQLIIILRIISIALLSPTLSLSLSLSLAYPPSHTASSHHLGTTYLLKFYYSTITSIASCLRPLAIACVASCRIMRSQAGGGMTCMILLLLC